MSTVTGVNLTPAARGRHSGGDGMEGRGVRAFPWTEIRSAPVTDHRHGRHRPRSAYLCEGRCPGCGRNPWAPGITTCRPKDVRGRPSLLHAWPEPTEEWPDPPGDDNPCRCGAHVGGHHHWLGSIEVCPWADEHPDDGEQLLCCGCFE